MCGNPGWAYRREAPCRTFIRRQGGFHTRKACNSLRPAGPTGYRCISSGTSISARTSKKRSLGINHIRAFHIPLNGASRTSAGSSAADAAETCRFRLRPSGFRLRAFWRYAATSRRDGPLNEIPGLCPGTKKAYQAGPDTLFQVWRRGELNPCPGHC